MAERVLCRYFMHGACKKGDACPFSHNWADQASTVCTFYQRGLCTFGDKCRYDHVKLPKPDTLGQDIANSTSRADGIAGGAGPAAQAAPYFQGTNAGPSNARMGNQGDRNFPSASNQIVTPGSSTSGSYIPAASRDHRPLNLIPIGISSPGVSGEYNLPATLDSPFGHSGGDWDFDEGLPEGAFDDEGIPDDEFEDFQKEAAEFAASGAALRQGLAEISLQDRQSTAEHSALNLQNSNFLHPSGSASAVQSGPYPAHHAGYLPPNFSSSLNPQAGVFRSALSGSASTFVPGHSQHINSRQASAPAAAASAAPVWGAASSSADTSASPTEDCIGEQRVATDEKPEDQPICAFAAAGNCLKGDACEQMHGDTCASCGKQCLHPFRPQEREQHQLSCERSQKLLEALRRSQEIECCVCLERVLAKPKISERKFGVLSGCDHCFCIACIRNWRGTNTSAGMDLDTVVRACPVCRVQSHYVTPSVVWYFSPEEKEDMVKGYKKRLNEIDCKHFDFGNGKCPFGTSCFYRHAYPDGRVEETKLRHLGSADGSTVIQKNIRLSDFLTASLTARR